MLENQFDFVGGLFQLKQKKVLKLISLTANENTNTFPQRLVNAIIGYAFVLKTGFMPKLFKLKVSPSVTIPENFINT